jgi:acetyl esterase/lipase
MCPALNTAGWATWNIEYRRVGNPGGGWPGTFLDVADAADFVRNLASKHGLDPSHVVSLGHSAGGHLALWLAGRRRIQSNSEIYRANPISLKAAVSLAGVADLRRGHEQFLGQGAVRNLVGGDPESHRDRYAAGSPADLLPLGVRQVLVHGTNDPIVPIGISRTYFDAAKAKQDPIELIELDGTGHFELVSPTTRQGQRVLDAMSKLL